MSILNSDWLIKMLEKSSKKPELRILNLFDILNDWGTAPSIEKDFLSEFSQANAPSKLIAFLTQQAQQTKADAPSILADQIVFLAKTALVTQLSTNSTDTLHHAKTTAQALIKAQCEKEKTSLLDLFKANKRPAYAGLGLIVLGAMIGSSLALGQKPSATIIDTSSSQLIQLPKGIAGDPKLTADMYASLETMRGGDCRFIEALLIPESDKKIYVENVVGGQAPTNLHDQLVAQRYIQKIHCNYTPMLMRNSTN